MEIVYGICALVGGTLLVCQFLASLVGFGDHHDVDGHDFHDFHADGAHDADHDHDQGHHTQSWFVGVLSFRAVVAALTFFGLAGLAGNASGWDQPMTLAVALAAGAGAVFLVAALMRTLHKLRAEGTARIERSVGKSGTVYLTVPAQKAGVGKVTLSLQNRTVEYQAMTSRQELPTGAKVVVVGVISPDTVEVLPATEPERISHV